MIGSEYSLLSFIVVDCALLKVVRARERSLGARCDVSPLRAIEYLILNSCVHEASLPDRGESSLDVFWQVRVSKRGGKARLAQGRRNGKEARWRCRQGNLRGNNQRATPFSVEMFGDGSRESACSL